MNNTAHTPDTMPLGLVILRLKAYCKDYTGRLMPGLNAVARKDENGVRDLLWEALEWERQDNSPQRMHSLAFILRQALQLSALHNINAKTARLIDPHDFS